MPSSVALAFGIAYSFNAVPNGPRPGTGPRLCACTPLDCEKGHWIQQETWGTAAGRTEELKLNHQYFYIDINQYKY